MKVILGTVLVFGLGVLITLPSLLAFTAQIVNLEAHIVQPPTIVKTRVGPDPVPVGTYQEWFFTITVTNGTGVPMENVVVVDRFGAELQGALDQPVENVEVVIREQTRGKSGKDSFESQTRITWCVTQPTVVAFGECSGTDTPLLPGESASLTIRLFTKLNPAGKQSYTSCGIYEQNSGAVVKWTFGPNDTQGSASTGSITVTVTGEGDDCPSGATATTSQTTTASSGTTTTTTSSTEPTPTPAPTPAPTAAPAPTPTPTAEPTPEPTPTPAPTPEPTPTPEGGP